MDFRQFKLCTIILSFVIVIISLLLAYFIPIMVNRETFALLLLLTTSVTFASYYGSSKITSKMVERYGVWVEENPVVRKAYMTGDWKQIRLREILMVLIYVSAFILLIFYEKICVWNILPYLYFAVLFLWNFLRELVIYLEYS